MFFKKNNGAATVPKVKRASDIIGASGSHKQKKYLSLMLVPSYTTGKTRTLRIPRAVFYCVLVGLFVVSAIIAGLQIRGTYLHRMAQEYRSELHLTIDEFEQHIFETEQELDAFLAVTQDMAGQLTAEQIDRVRERTNLQRDHRDSLEYLEERLYDLQRNIEYFDERLIGAIHGLAARTFIPALAPLVDQLNESQAALRATFELDLGLFYANGYANGYTNGLPMAAARALVDYDYDGNGFVPLHAMAMPVAVTEESLLLQIDESLRILEQLIILTDDLMAHRQRIDPLSSNHPTLWPVSAPISSYFGNRPCPFGGSTWQFHSGIDIAAPTGTPIRATGGGRVTFSGWMNGGLGNVVMIYHGNGIETLYAHNSINLVYVGQQVARGDVIARVGTTGSVTGPHVHYEVRVNGRVVNPITYLLE